MSGMRFPSHINAVQRTSGNRDSNAITAEFCLLVQRDQ